MTKNEPRRRAKAIASELWTLILLGTLAVGAMGCGDRASGSKGDLTAEESEEMASKAIPVEVVELTRGPIEAVLRFSADLEAEESVPVYARASNHITRLLVEEGDSVSKGQLMVILESDEQRNSVQRIESQLAKAQRDLDRQQNLYDQKLVSEQVFIDARYDLEQLQLNLADARRQLSYTEVRAPIHGTVTQRLVNVGDQVNVNQHLFDLVDFDSLVVRLYVPERDLSKVAVGQETRLTSEALPGRIFFGRVSRVAPIVDPQTGTVKVTVDVPAESGLLPGLFLEANLVTAVEDDALLVPKRSLVLDEDQAFVFRLGADDTVEKIRARPVLEDSNWIEVREGLSAGDRIVIAGQAGLKDGDTVRLVGDAAEATTEAAVEDSTDA